MIGYVLVGWFRLLLGAGVCLVFAVVLDIALVCCLVLGVGIVVLLLIALFELVVIVDLVDV